METYPKREVGAWLHVRPFLQALLGETVTGMFQGNDEAAARLMANSLRLQGVGKWRDLTEAAGGIEFFANFVGWFSSEIDDDAYFRYAFGTTPLRAVDMEQDFDKRFRAAANKKEALDRGWVHAEYCRKWVGRPTPADNAAWRATKPAGDMDNPLLTFESFPGLERARPGVKDIMALKRLVCSGSRHHHFGSSSSRSDLLISSVRRRNCPGNRPTAQPSPNGRRGSRQSPGGNRSPKHSWFYETAVGTTSPLSINPSPTRAPAAKVATPNAPNR